ncbi:hypothetical protein Q9L58_000350 [Maublancomyces gigas]|uniref:Uncharacterized protein n=1 Tax=Discina gigas TaxID=1032678 RepID=A0ABR3GXM6_9PEZI
MDNPPFLVWEILDSQPLQQMEHKVREYFVGAAGKVRVVIILQPPRQPPPPKVGKRKRNRVSLSDKERALQTPDTSAAGKDSATPVGMTGADPDIAPTPADEPTPTSNPAAGHRRSWSLLGTHTTSASTNKSSTLRPAKSSEFYPRHSRIDLGTRPRPFPYQIFHDKFTELMLLPVVEPRDEVSAWGALEVEGIPA